MQTFYYVRLPDGRKNELGAFASYESAEMAMYNWAHEQAGKDDDETFYTLVNRMSIGALDTAPFYQMPSLVHKG